MEFAAGVEMGVVYQAGLAGEGGDGEQGAGDGGGHGQQGVAVHGAEVVEAQARFGGDGGVAVGEERRRVALAGGVGFAEMAQSAERARAAWRSPEESKRLRELIATPSGSRTIGQMIISMGRKKSRTMRRSTAHWAASFWPK